MSEALFGWPPPVLDPAGPYAAPITRVAWALFGMGTLVTLIVIAALWLALRGPAKMRARLGGERTIWLAGVAFPALVLTGLLIWGLALTSRLSGSISGVEQRIRVTGEMWWFRVEYLDGRGRVALADANELHIPVGRPVVLELRSADVIHSFWVPHLSGKKDMIPGRTNLLRIAASRPKAAHCSWNRGAPPATASPGPRPMAWPGPTLAMSRRGGRWGRGFCRIIAAR